ncbi:MAG TPA: site-2 protease family protein [Anaeromyxobacteraceae bacterium]|jgi:Zn-dependent protease|nr:site-2 protease family protein [Anaeromyxobacteraceae bacterium]
MNRTNEPAAFRPPLRGVGLPLLLGVLGGGAVGLVAGIPLLVAALFGGAASAIALSLRQLSGIKVVASEAGLEVARKEAPFRAPWSELRLGFGLAMRGDGTVQRYAVVADAAGRSFAFAEPVSGAPCQPVSGADGRPVPVVELREAALLLAVIVQRAPRWEVLPEGLRSAPVDLAAELAAAAEVAPSPTLPRSAGEGEGAPQGAMPGRGGREAPAARGRRLGVLGLLAKLGSKLTASLGKVGATALKAAKTANVGWAAASVATWSVLFSWKFALAIMVQLFVHEYGHVHAMRRVGMKVRGLYFVPMLGAMAVTEDAFPSRRAQAYVALNGPLWGSLLALVPAGLYAWTHHPLYAAIASWWALLNLFNLLPIAPLDGGRVMQAFAYSYSSSLGLAVSVLGLAGAVALGASLGFSLIYLVALLGLMELVAESQARAGARALRLLPEPARFGPRHYLYLRAVAGPAPGSSSEPLFLKGLERQQQAARAAPLGGWELVAWGLAYAGLAAALVVMVYLLRSAPGAEAASRLLE